MSKTKELTLTIISILSFAIVATMLLVTAISYRDQIRNLETRCDIQESVYTNNVEAMQDSLLILKNEINELEKEIKQINYQKDIDILNTNLKELKIQVNSNSIMSKEWGEDIFRLHRWYWKLKK